MGGNISNSAVAETSTGNCAIAEPRVARSSGVRVAQNATALFAGRGFALLFAAAANALLARSLGVQKLGEYGAIYAYLALFGWLASLGLQPVLIREASERRAASGRVIGTGIWLTVFAAVPTLALGIVLAPVAHLGGGLLALVFLGGIEIFVVPILMVPGVMFQVEMEQWYPAAYGILRQAIWFAIVVVLYLAGAPLIWVVAGRLFAALIEGILNWSGGRRRTSGAWNFDRSRARGLVVHSLPGSIGALAWFVYLRIDQVMLHRMVNDYALGQYVAAVRISELTETVSTAVIFAIFPVLCAAAASPERFGNYVSTIFRMLLFGISCLCLAVFACSNFIISVYYGPRFLSSAPLLRILVWSEIAVFFSAVVNASLLAGARERFVLVPTISGAVLNVVLNLVWIPKYGPAGACWATLVSYGIGSTLMLLPLRTARGLLLRGWRVLAPAIFLLSIALAAIAYIPANAAVRGLVGVAVFVCGAPLFGIITREDFRFGRQFLGRFLSTVNSANSATEGVGS